MQEVNLPAKHAAVFDLCWRTMRDNWYDERLNNRDWKQVKEKYLPMAFACPDLESLATTVNMMLGELNGSHLAFTANGGTNPMRRGTPAPAANEAPTGKWSLTTVHPGLLFDEKFAGPGWKIRSVVQDTPAAHKRHGLKAGELVTSVNGKAVTPELIRRSC